MNNMLITVDEYGDVIKNYVGETYLSPYILETIAYERRFTGIMIYNDEVYHFKSGIREL